MCTCKCVSPSLSHCGGVMGRLTPPPQKALNVAKRQPYNTVAYTKSMSRALRLIQIKTDQNQFMAEAREIEDILRTLTEGSE